LSTTSSWINVAVCRTSIATAAVNSASFSGSPIRALKTSKIGRTRLPPAVSASSAGATSFSGARPATQVSLSSASEIASEAPSGRAARRLRALSVRFRPDVERDDAAREPPPCNAL
jgi:hypothetical protein